MSAMASFFMFPAGLEFDKDVLFVQDAGNEPEQHDVEDGEEQRCQPQVVREQSAQGDEDRLEEEWLHRDHTSVVRYFDQGERLGYQGREGENEQRVHPEDQRRIGPAVLVAHVVVADGRGEYGPGC